MSVLDTLPEGVTGIDTHMGGASEITAGFLLAGEHWPCWSVCTGRPRNPLRPLWSCWARRALRAWWPHPIEVERLLVLGALGSRLSIDDAQQTDGFALAL